MPALQRLMAEHMRANVNESNCIDLLLYFGDQEEYAELKARCIEEAAQQFPFVAQTENFLSVNFNDLKTKFDCYRCVAYLTHLSGILLNNRDTRM